MSALLLPRRRIHQPAGLVEIDWSNPLMRGLVFATTPDAQGRNLAKPGAVLNTTTVLQRPLHSYRYTTDGEVENEVLLPTNDFTLFSIWHCGTAGEYSNFQSGNAMLSTRTAGNEGFSWTRQGVIDSTGEGRITKQGLVFQGVAAYEEANCTIPSFRPTPVAVRYVRSTGVISWFSRGVKSSADTSASTSPSNGGNLNYRRQGPFANTGADFTEADAITLAFARAMSDADIANLSANAWQALKPVQRRLYFDAVAPPPDTTAPTVTSVGAVVKSNALAVISATTNEANGTMYVVTTTSATPPDADQVMAGTDHADAAAVFDASQSIGSTGAKTFNATGHTALTTYYGYVMHRDAAGNNSDVEATGSFVMFADGATGQAIIDDTSAIPGVQEDGILVNDVELPADADKWFTYDVVTPVVDTASLTLFPNGSFIWTGTSADSFTYQLKVDGVDVGTPQLVTLYPEGEGPPPDPTPSNATKRTPNGMIGFWNR